MKKSVIALGALAMFANAAQAQDADVTLYGVIDLAVGTVKESLSANSNFPATVIPGTSKTATSVNSSVTGMFNGGISDSRWGLRGSENLGGGMQAFFLLESGIDANSGSLNSAAGALSQNTSTKTGTASATSALDGQLFNRAAYVGLSDGNLGSLSFGRNTNPIFDLAVGYDPLQDAQLLSPLGFSGAIGGGGGVSDYSRLDNSLKYKNKLGDVNVGALYKFGGYAGNNAAGSGYALSAGYEAGKFGVQAVYESFADVIKSTNPSTVGDIGVLLYDTKAFMTAAKYHVTDAWTVEAGFERYSLNAASDTLASLGVTSLYGYPISTTSAAATYTGPNQANNVYFVGGDYNITPAFNLAAAFYDQHAQVFASTPSGDIRSYSVLADYHLSKRSDVYAGFMYSTFSSTDAGGLYAGNNPNNYIVAIGVRHKF
jgi:predicted porin